MAKYVISDLHGNYEKYKAMLELINFGEDDTLYILGDVFDRGPEPIKILDHIIENDNIILIKGNHEKFFEDFFESENPYIWYGNGGRVTHNQLLEKDYVEYEKIYRYIKELPYIKVIDKYILVHAGIMFPSKYEDMTLDEFVNWQEEEHCLWDRKMYARTKQYKDYVVICGHTPVQTIDNEYSDNPKIAKKDGVIMIDCACSYKGVNGVLACLRLDDLEEFYI